MVSTSMAQTAELKVLSSNAFKEAYLELVPGFEKATEHKVVDHLGRHQRHPQADAGGRDL